MDEQARVVSLSIEQIARLKFEVTRGRPYSNRISLALAKRLLDQSNPYFSPFHVLNELDYLEGIRPVSRTKPPSAFKGKDLKPFWHKHFYSPRHLLKNLGVRWNIEGGGNSDLEKMIRDVAQEHGENPDAWIKRLVHRFIMDGYQERAQRGLTGDWIVYAKHEGLNYYLDLATHEEGAVDCTAQLAKKLRQGSFAEFHFVFLP